MTLEGHSPLKMEKQRAAYLGTLGIFFCLWRPDLERMNRNVDKEDRESKEGKSSSREEVGESLPSERLQQEWNARAGCVGRTASAGRCKVPSSSECGFMTQL